MKYLVWFEQTWKPYTHFKLSWIHHEQNLNRMYYFLYGYFMQIPMASRRNDNVFELLNILVFKWQHLRVSHFWKLFFLNIHNQLGCARSLLYWPYQELFQHDMKLLLWTWFFVAYIMVVIFLGNLCPWFSNTHNYQENVKNWVWQPNFLLLKISKSKQAHSI